MSHQLKRFMNVKQLVTKQNVKGINEKVTITRGRKINNEQDGTMK